jgi:hypothetical protein
MNEIFPAVMPRFPAGELNERSLSLKRLLIYISVTQGESRIIFHAPRWDVHRVNPSVTTP